MKRTEMKAHAKVIVDKLFDIPALKENVEANVNSVDRYMEEDGRATVYLLTLMGGNWGSHIYNSLYTDIFELGNLHVETPEDLSDFVEEVDYFSSVVAEELDSRYPELEGNFHFGGHEADGSYCLFYSWDIGEEGEEEPECLYEEVDTMIKAYAEGEAGSYDMYCLLVKIKEHWDKEEDNKNPDLYTCDHCGKEIEEELYESNGGYCNPCQEDYEHMKVQNAEAENYRIANNMKEDGEI